MFENHPTNFVRAHNALWASPNLFMSGALSCLTASYGKEGKNSDPFWTGEKTVAPKGYTSCRSHIGAHVACLTSSLAVASAGIHTDSCRECFRLGLSIQGSEP